MSKYKIFVGGKAIGRDGPEGLNEDDLRDSFKVFGAIRDVNVGRNPCGFGFVEFEEAEDCSKALEEARDSFTVRGFPVQVQRAKSSDREIQSGEIVDQRREKGRQNDRPAYGRDRHDTRYDSRRSARPEYGSRGERGYDAGRGGSAYRDGPPDRGYESRGRGGFAEPRGSQLVKPGDWICPDCGVNNFARRTTCFKCGAPGGAPPGDPYVPASRERFDRPQRSSYNDRYDAPPRAVDGAYPRVEKAPYREPSPAIGVDGYRSRGEPRGLAYDREDRVRYGRDTGYHKEPYSGALRGAYEEPRAYGGAYPDDRGYSGRDKRDSSAYERNDYSRGNGHGYQKSGEDYKRRGTGDRDYQKRDYRGDDRNYSGGREKAEYSSSAQAKDHGMIDPFEYNKGSSEKAPVDDKYAK